MGASPFLVPVARLLRGDQAEVSVTFSAPFDAENEFEPRGFAESDVPRDAVVDVAVVLRTYLGGIRARGTVQVPWTGTCRRCSRAIEAELLVRVDERFVQGAQPDDEEAYGFERDQLSLEPMVHDAVWLDLPIAPLCREDCRGLCPICGVDHNEEDCQCRPEIDPRWATLDALRFEDPSSD